MFANILPWLLSHALGKLSSEAEKAVEDIVNIGVFCTQVLGAEVGASVTSQPVDVAELGREYDVQLLITRKK